MEKGNELLGSLQCPQALYATLKVRILKHPEMADVYARVGARLDRMEELTTPGPDPALIGEVGEKLSALSDVACLIWAAMTEGVCDVQCRTWHENVAAIHEAMFRLGYDTAKQERITKDLSAFTEAIDAPANDNPRRTPQLQHFLDGMQEAMGMDDEEARVLIEGSDHSYSCRCAICLDWWASMGPERKDGKTPTWGPFTEQEIKDHQASKADLTSQP